VTELDKLKREGKAPEHLTEEGFKTLKGGYLLNGETPVDMYKRVSEAAANYLPSEIRSEYESKFYEAIFNGWLGLATPVASNMGTARSLPISCFSSYMPDTLPGIFDTVKEVATMTKFGGGTAVHMNGLRGSDSPVIGTGGVASGPNSWAKILDSTITAVSQGAIRRGAVAAYLPIEHYDSSSFIMLRHPSQDQNKYCPNIHHGVTITDVFMQEMLAGNQDKRDKWKHLLTTRFETGEPYLFFSDTAQKGNPKHLPWYRVNGSNLCNEVFLHTDEDHSLVCCLSSLNLAKYDEWKDTDVIKTSIYFLDAVMQEFIDKSYYIPGLERAYRFAIKSRALGLGVLGWHTLLQDRMLPFDSFDSMMLNAQIFSKLQKEADSASRELAQLLGEPEWMQGTGRRNSHLLAVAPTVSNALISGGVSQGVEPISANVYVQKSAKGTFIRYNPTLKAKLASMGLDNDTIWNQIIKEEGSVLGVKELPEDFKQVFLTAREINQFAIVKQAGQRQAFIDQGQSINLFFSANSDPKYIHQVHVAAWQEGLKGLYYLRSSSPIRADLASRSANDCASCDG
jgi:ribonucleoside-diphosphate reductase alpha chain